MIFNVKQDEQFLNIESSSCKFVWDMHQGVLSQINVYDGIRWNKILHKELEACSLQEIKLAEIKVC